MASRAASGKSSGYPGHHLRQFFLAAHLQERRSPRPFERDRGRVPTAGAGPGRVL